VFKNCQLWALWLLYAALLKAWLSYFMPGSPGSFHLSWTELKRLLTFSSCCSVIEHSISKASLLFKRTTLNIRYVSTYFVFFYFRKIHPASLSIMLGHEHNFEHNAMSLGVTLKTIILKFSNVIYLTLVTLWGDSKWTRDPINWQWLGLDMLIRLF